MHNTDETTLDTVIFDGIKFLESLTMYYGPEKGMAVWESMGEAMGREIKGKVFFAMLSGTTTGRIRLAASSAVHTSSQGGTSNAVPVIKCIRTYTGFGLKEAKDLWDLSKTQTVEITCRPDQQREFARDLRDLGCKVA